MGRLDVRICSGRNFPDPLIGKPRTYCHVVVAGEVKETTEQSSNHPVWDEVLKFSVPTPDDQWLLVEIRERTVVGKDNIVGKCGVALKDLPYNRVVDKWYHLQGCETNAELRIRLIAKDFGIEPHHEDLNASTTLTSAAVAAVLASSVNTAPSDNGAEDLLKESSSFVAPISMVQCEQVSMKGCSTAPHLEGSVRSAPMMVPLESSQNVGIPSQPMGMMTESAAPPVQNVVAEDAVRGCEATLAPSVSLGQYPQASQTFVPQQQQPQMSPQAQPHQAYPPPQQLSEQQTYSAPQQQPQPQMMAQQPPPQMMAQQQPPPQPYPQQPQMMAQQPPPQAYALQPQMMPQQQPPPQPYPQQPQMQPMPAQPRPYAMPVYGPAGGQPVYPSATATYPTAAAQPTYGAPVHYGNTYAPQQGPGFYPAPGGGYPPPPNMGGYPPAPNMGYPPPPAAAGPGYPPPPTFGYPPAGGPGYPQPPNLGYPPSPAGQGYGGYPTY